LQAVLAHDLNNYLMPIINYGDMIREGLGEGAESAHYFDYVEGILRSSERARELTE
jgi:signal transduction histidine kinase